MIDELPAYIYPIFIKIDLKTIEIGIEDIRTHEKLDCCRYCSDKQLTPESIRLFQRDFYYDLKESGVI